MFEAFSRCVSISWWFKATVAAYWKLLLSPFFRFIVAFLFFNYTGKSMYDRPCLKVTVWHLKCIYWTKSKTKSLPLFQVSELSRYLERRDSKSSLTTLFTSLLDVHFTLSLVVYISRSCPVSFEEVKLIAAVIWIFQKSERWRSFIIFFKWVLILFRYLFRDKLLTPLDSYLT